MAILFLGFVFSIAGGFGNVVVRESMDQAVYGSKGVIAITKAPPLAVIPYIECSQDQRKQTKVSAITVFGLIAAVVVIFTSVHLFYKPFDVIFYIVMRKLGIELGA
jgi:hypothetical protein